MKLVEYNSPNKLIVGPYIPVRVNLSVGIENSDVLRREEAKVQAIIETVEPPDLIMDLSIVKSDRELWSSIRDVFLGPIGVVPHYAIFSDHLGLDINRLLERIGTLFEGGINFITIHCTPSLKLVELAKKTRYLPITSRGGGIIVRDMFLNNRIESIYSIIFEKICYLAKQYSAVINLGTTFRAASVAEGFDEVARQEIQDQTKYCEIAEKIGVQIVLEGPGHISLSDLNNYYDHIKHLNVPPMPLGPIVSDTNSEIDHIAAAVGAANLMMLTKGGVINSITSTEHRGGVPSLNQLIDGLKTAQLAAQIASLTYNKQAFEKEKIIARDRGRLKSCNLEQNNHGCSRCGKICPLRTENYAN